jgi:hypothetical protein
VFTEAVNRTPKGEINPQRVPVSDPEAMIRKIRKERREKEKAEREALEKQHLQLPCEPTANNSQRINEK